MLGFPYGQTPQAFKEFEKGLKHLFFLSDEESHNIENIVNIMIQPVLNAVLRKQSEADESIFH